MAAAKTSAASMAVKRTHYAKPRTRKLSGTLRKVARSLSALPPNSETDKIFKKPGSTLYFTVAAAAADRLQAANEEKK